MKLIIATILFFCICQFQYVDNCMTESQTNNPFNVSGTSDPFNLPGRAIAIMRGTGITGMVTFEKTSVDGPINVFGNITGVNVVAGVSRHGFHIHNTAITVLATDVSQCSAASTGGHFNPTGETHGNANSIVNHHGDYGNVVADAQGNIIVSIVDTQNVLFGPNGIVGRTLMLHAGTDDLGLGGNAGSLAAGNAGPRIACGQIGVF